MIDAARWRTVVDVVPLAEPDVAVMVACPSATAVTRPVDETLATADADDDHVTDASLIVAPFWSVTAAASSCVSPNDEKLRAGGERVTVVATGA